MRILLITPFLPHRAVGHGTATVASHYLDYFSVRHDVSVLTFRFSEDERELSEAVRRKCRGFDAVGFPGARWVDRQRRRLLNAFSSRPFLVSLFDVPEMRRRIAAVTNAEPFDVVQMDTTLMGQYVDSVPAGSAKTVLVEIDVSTRPLRREYEAAGTLVQRGLRYREWRRMSAYEPRLCRKFDLVFTVSEEDRDLLAAAEPSVTSSLFRYGVDPELFGLSPKPGPGKTLLFLGSFMHRPNVDAVHWFHEAILPLVRESEPDVEVLYAGSRPTPDIERLAEERGVTVTGFVPNMAETLARADVAIVPLRLGGGVKLKTLEMMAAGRAVVTTTVGSEGVRLRDGVHACVADTAEAFAAGIVGLLGRPDERQAMGRRARELMRAQHNWPDNLGRVEKELERLLLEAHRLGTGKSPGAARALRVDDGPSLCMEGRSRTSASPSERTT